MKTKRDMIYSLLVDVFQDQRQVKKFIKNNKQVKKIIKRLNSLIDYLYTMKNYQDEEQKLLTDIVIDDVEQQENEG